MATDNHNDERSESKVEAATGYPRLTPGFDDQHADTSDSDATDVMDDGAADMDTGPVPTPPTEAQALIDEDLDRFRQH